MIRFRVTKNIRRKMEGHGRDMERRVAIWEAREAGRRVYGRTWETSSNMEDMGSRSSNMGSSSNMGDMGSSSSSNMGRSSNMGDMGRRVVIWEDMKGYGETSSNMGGKGDWEGIRERSILACWELNTESGRSRER